MSAFLTSMETKYPNESKHYNMKQFISAVEVYIKTRTEESASLINRHLNLLGSAIDHSVFDPNTSVVCEFYVSLHELLTSLEPRSSLAWCCINVLNNTCRNPAARNQLIHTYQFIPALSRLLGDHLNDDKKVRLLTVMQELSCGLKISWQIPHLAYLMSTLSKWLINQSQNEQVTMLSLGVLVNLCYKNLPAVYTLSRCVEIKKLVRVCSKLKGVQMEVTVCKLTIILDYSHQTIPEEVLQKLINVTFESIVEAFEARDAILLRHIVEFYLDVKDQNEKTGVDNLEAFAMYGSYDTKVNLLVNVMNCDTSTAAGDASQPTPECMSIVFQFLHSLIELNLPKLIPMYPKFVQIALRWIQTEMVCSEALGMLRTIALRSELRDQDVTEPLLSAMPILMIGLEPIEEDVIMNIEQCRHLTSVMQLLRALMMSDMTKDNVLALIENKQEILKVFVPLIGNQSKAGDKNNWSSEAVSLYVNTLALTNELARFSKQWVNPLTTLLQHRQIHAVMAEALYNGSNEMKSLILGMAAYSHFPINDVAVAMNAQQPLLKVDAQNFSNAFSQNDQMYNNSMLSIAQSAKLEQTIQKVKTACEENQVANIATSDVMELYEYKLASMGHAERAAMASVDAASQRCTHLNHQVAQLTAEISRIRQLFIHTQQSYEELNKSKKTLVDNNRDLVVRLDAEKGRYKVLLCQIAQKDSLISERNEEIEQFEKKLKEKNANIRTLEDGHVKLKEIVSKLEGNLTRQEASAERKDELIKIANAKVEHFKKQVIQMELQIKHTEQQLKERNEELHDVTAELTVKSHIIDSITQLTKSKK